MPPKTRGTRTRGHLQEKERGRETATDKTPLDSFQSSQETASSANSPVVSVKRLRIRSVTASGRSSASKGEEVKTRQPSEAAKGKSRAKGKNKDEGETGEVTMASTTGGRKRRQKAATATAEIKGEGDGETVEGKVPPTKRRKNDKKSEPVEDVDRAVFAPQPAPVSSVKQRQKKLPKHTESSPMDTGEAPFISHHSHSNVTGQVFVMGQGDMGQLGLGENMLERKKPHPVGGVLEGCAVSQVVCGGMHTVALSKDGKVFTWGCNDEGALGRVIEDGDEFNPKVVQKLEGVKVVQVAAGDSHTVALADNGIIYCWGVFRDSNGAFGLVQKTPSLSPEVLYSNPHNRALKVASGSDHVAFITERGDIFTFGCAEQGQLGRVPECFSSRGGRKGLSQLLKPDLVRCRVKKGVGKPKFTDVFCGPYHTFAVAQDGVVYVWGLNNYGQLCTGDQTTRYQPQRLDDSWIGGRGGVGGAEGFTIASGQHHTVVCCDGNVLTCGRREYGRLGLGEDSEEPSVLTHVESLKGVKARSVEAAGSCSFVVTATGELYSWGMGTNLQLGMSDEEDVWTPAKVTGKKIENCRISSVSAGGQHTALLVSSTDF